MYPYSTLQHQISAVAAEMTESVPPQSALEKAIEFFHNHFASVTGYGERWHRTLFDALADESSYVALHNRYTPLDEFRGIMFPEKTIDCPVELVRFPSADDDIQADNLRCFPYEVDDSKDPLTKLASNGLATYAIFEGAVVLAAHLLQVVPGDNVLDLRASARGGPGIESSNSIILAQSIWPALYPDTGRPRMRGAKKGLLHTAGVDESANERVTALMDKYLPPDIVPAGGWRIAEVDGTKRDPARDLRFDGINGYDKVLVDAPSTREGYIAQAIVGEDRSLLPDELRDWKPSSIKLKVEDQLKLLTTALRAVRFGGRVVYTTTSISNDENDGIVEKIISTTDGAAIDGSTPWTFHVEPLDEQVEQRLAAGWAEKTTHGWMVLPDHPSGGGWGPRYISILTKKNRT
jgi:hypothetical protein